MRFPRGRYTIEMTNEPNHSFGSVDNVRTYAQEYLLGQHVQSKHGLRCVEGDAIHGAAIIGADGGATGISEHSCVLLDDRCYVAVGDSVACLALPDLSLLWRLQGDDATCFGVHLGLDERFLIVHGELEIRRLTLDGVLVWSFAGRDIFTGDCVLSQDAVVVADFEGERYSIDFQDGLDRRVGK